LFESPGTRVVNAVAKLNRLAGIFGTTLYGDFCGKVDKVFCKTNTSWLLWICIIALGLQALPPLHVCL